MLSHSVTESTSHYAALSLYNISSIDFERKIEKKLFLNESKVEFVKGLLKEKWIRKSIRREKSKKQKVESRVENQVQQKSERFVKIFKFC